jgi:hypothetical protein
MRIQITSNKSTEWYFLTVCIILVYTASLKLMSVAENNESMLLSDPLFHIGNRCVLVFVAILEVSIGVYALLGRETWKRALRLLWLNANFLHYRWGISIVAPGEPCRCLGTVSIWLPWRPKNLDILLASIIIYFIVGTTLILLSAFLNAQRYDPIGNQNAHSSN